MASKPLFGERVRFTHYFDKPNDKEIQVRGEELDGEEGTITLQRRENPNIDKPAVVIGKCSVNSEADVEYNDDRGRFYVWWRQGSKHRTAFYALKRSYRERRFYVALEDIRRKEGTP